MNIFINRFPELKALEDAYRQEGSSLFVLYGRRRLGKTALLRQLAARHPSIYYMADRTVEKDAIQLMAKAMALELNEPTLETSEYGDWYALFPAFDRLRPKSKLILILDEFQYLCEIEPAFSSIIQKWWDEHWKDGNLMLVLSGSVLSMMYRETLSRTSPLYGRRTGQWLLKPLRFSHVIKFFRDDEPEERIKLWALTGGVPYYAKLVSRRGNFEKSLRECVLAREGPLYAEAKFLLQSEVTAENVYWSLLHSVGSGVNRISEIAGRMGLAANQLTRYLSTLQEMGWVVREVPVTENQPKKSKRGIYQIPDSFLKLWFGVVSPYESLLEFGRVDDVRRLMDERLSAHFAWAFEQICKEYIEDRITEYGALRVGRYWDRITELDVVACDGNGHVVFAGECKWSKQLVNLYEYEFLKRKVFKLWPSRLKKIRLAIFSRSGFTSKLLQIAEKENLLLVNCKKLVT